VKSNTAFALLSILALASACKKDDEEEETPKKKPTASATQAATPTPPPATTSAQVVPETPANVSLAKSELDGKEPDAGWAGTSLVVGKLTFVHPKEWTSKAGDFTAASAGDGAQRFTAGKYPDGAAPTGSMDAATKALGLTECAWGTADNISLGKDHLSATAADGTCKREGKAVKAIYAPTASTF
jgi:hypothetical protein